VPLPVRDIDKPFAIAIEDIFSISGRGTVVTGRVERGKVKLAKKVEIVGFRETQRRWLPASKCSASYWMKVGGRHVGLLLRGHGKEMWNAGR